MTTPPIKWMEKVIRIDSTTDKSNEEIVRFLAPHLAELGLTVQEQKVVENGVVFKNLIAFSHTPNHAELMAFNTHLDTVSCGNRSDWTKTGGDPFRATRVRNRIYGLGSADVKIDFLCKIWAAKLSKPWKRPILLVGTYGEERGLVGAEKLLKLGKVVPRYALIGEPSNLELIYAHKGHLVFTVEVRKEDTASSDGIQKKWKGKAAHSATPSLGTNAIRKGLNEILKRGLGILTLDGGTDSNRIPDLCIAKVTSSKNSQTQRIHQLLSKFDEIERDLKKRKNNRFDPATSTLSLNQARTEGDKIYLTFDSRTLPDIDAERLLSKLTQAAAASGCHILESTINDALKGRRENKLMRMASEALKNCGVKVIKKTKATSTEAAIYNKMGAEAIVFGPGISTGNVHRPNEYNLLPQIEVATRFYTNLMSFPVTVSGGRS